MGGGAKEGASSYGGRERGLSPKAPAATAENRVSQGGWWPAAAPPDSLLPKLLLSVGGFRSLFFLLSASLLLAFLSLSAGLCLSVGSYFFCFPLAVCMHWALCDSLHLCFCRRVPLLNFISWLVFFFSLFLGLHVKPLL